MSPIGRCRERSPICSTEPTSTSSSRRCRCVDLIATGKLRALAVTAPTRMPALNDVPTVGEAGFPDLIIQDWFGFLVKTGTPDEIVVRLNEAINKALASHACGSHREDGRRACRRHAGRVRTIPRLPARALEQGREGVRDQNAPMTSSNDFRVTLLGTGVPIPSPASVRTEHAGRGRRSEAPDRRRPRRLDPALSAQRADGAASTRCCSPTITRITRRGFPTSG